MFENDNGVVGRLGMGEIVGRGDNEHFCGIEEGVLAEHEMG